MRIRSAIPSSLGLNSYGTRALNPLLGRKRKTVEARLFSKPVEFDGIKGRVVDLFPNPKKLNGIAVSQPIAN